MSDQIDISRGMVEHLCHIHRGYEQHGTVAMLLALRTALDAAEAREKRAVEAERERCALVAEHMATVFLSDEYSTGQPFASVSERLACASIAAALHAGAKP